MRLIKAPKRNGNSKLSEAQVRAIKQALAEGDTHGALARLYGVSAETIGRIARGETWGWLDAPAGQAPVEHVPLTEADQLDAAASLARLQERLKGGG